MACGSISAAGCLFTVLRTARPGHRKYAFFLFPEKPFGGCHRTESEPFSGECRMAYFDGVHSAGVCYRMRAGDFSLSYGRYPYGVFVYFYVVSLECHPVYLPFSPVMSSASVMAVPLGASSLCIWWVSDMESSYCG